MAPKIIHTSWRYERKYLLEIADPKLLWPALYQIGFEKAFADRSVHNIYYDTHFLNHFHDSVEGHFQRRKIRLRWYQQQPNKSQLEIKIKQGHLGKKIIFYDPIQIKKHLKNLKAMASTDYQRSYWQAKNQPQLRLTLDTKLRFNQQAKNIHILEIKYPPQEKIEILVSQILQKLPVNLNQFSKYTAATGEKFVWL